MEVLRPPNVDEIRILPIFRDMPDAELKAIVKVTGKERYKKDDYIITEEEIGDALYILLTGSLYVVKSIEKNKQEVINLIDEPGDLFGEMALVEDKPRCAGVVVSENCEVLTIGRDGFMELVNQFPRFTLKIAQNISNYLRTTDQKLINMLKEKNAELQEAYDKLKDAQDELLRQERISMVGRMATTLLHDMKNPMSAISGYAQLIKLKDQPRDKLMKYADVINREVKHFSSMAQELQAFARGEGKLHKVHLDLNLFLAEVLENMSFKFTEAGMKLESELNFDGEVHFDPSRMRRAIENISNNAIEAMGEQGVLSVETMPSDFGVKIMLRDNGLGMTEEVREQIFNEFFTYGKSTGTGLGMAITRKIIEDHGGNIKVESKLGEGSNFIIELPIAKV